MGTKEVSILIIGRVCNVKQQVKLVRETKTKINDNVKFYFVGIGEELPGTGGNSGQKTVVRAAVL